MIRKKNNKKFKSVQPWWDVECEILLNKRKRAFKKLSRCPSRINLSEYRNISSFVRKELQKKKRNSFRDFVSDLCLTSAPLKFCDTIKKFKNSHHFNPPDMIRTDNQGVIEDYISRLAPMGMSPRMAPCNVSHVPSFFSHEIKIEELQEIIDSLNSNSALGPDLLNHKIIKLIPVVGLERLLEIFNMILKGNYYPKMWKSFTVILLQKPNKKDFRPISLASCTLKILERLVKRRLERYVELDYLIPNSQFGFRKGKSCDDCISLINLEIHKSFMAGEKLGAIFLDIKAAYDNVIPSIMFDIINSLKIPYGYKKFIKDLLVYRCVDIFESGIYRGRRSLYKGLPQGSVLSPLLFNLYVKDVNKAVPYNCNIIQFADDIVILCRDKVVDWIYSCLSETFNKINIWLESMGLELSIPKTQFVLFHRSRNSLFPDRLEVLGGHVLRLKKAKYLGLILDSGLRWLEHIKEIKLKSAKFKNVLKWFMGRSWGIDTLQAIIFVNATIVAQLSWGATWFINAANSHIKHIDNIISSSYKLALGLPKKSANIVCWKFSNQHTFRAKVIQTCDRYLCKAFILGKNKIINKIKFIWDQYKAGKISKSKVPLLVTRWREVEPLLKYSNKLGIHPMYTFPFKNKFIQSDFDFLSGKLAKDNNDPEKTFFQLLQDSKKYPEEIIIYTDGSKYVREDPKEDEILVGCAVLIPFMDKSFSFKLNSMTNSFTAEVLAIDKALQLTDTYGWSRVNICSDSLSVLQALKFAEQSFFPRSINKLNMALADLSYKLSRMNFNFIRVRFTWCPAHVGIIMNEKVDLMAKRAAIDGEIWNNNISYEEIISSLKPLYKYIDSESFLLRSGKVGSYYFNNFNNINIETAKKFTKNGTDCKILIRIVTGYSGTNLYLFKRQLIDSPRCPCGEAAQDLNHIFWACPILNVERERLIILLRKLQLFDPFSIEYVLGNLNKKFTAILVKFAIVANEKLNISL